MHNNLKTDSTRGRKLAAYLYDTFQNRGIHGRNDMPEDVLPAPMERG